MKITRGKWYAAVAAVLVAVMLVSGAAPALAERAPDLDTEARPLHGALAVKAPRAAAVGAEVTIRVFDRRTTEPVAGAGVWALTRDAARKLKADIATLREDAALPAADIDREAVLSARGTFLGRTNEEGTVTHAFQEAGRYLLVAFKPGYLPGFGRIAVYSMPKVLGIRAPRVTREGDAVTMSVIERRTGEAVAGANVWLVDRAKTGKMKGAFARLRKRGGASAAESDGETALAGCGRFLGTTDEHGELVHTFDEAGRYWLVAVKGGFFPGIAPMNVRGQGPDGASLDIESFSRPERLGERGGHRVIHRPGEDETTED